MLKKTEIKKKRKLSFWIVIGVIILITFILGILPKMGVNMFSLKQETLPEINAYSEEESGAVFYTPSTETHCDENGKCWKKIGSLENIYEDGVWKKIWNARSLKDVWKKVYLEKDPDFDIDVVSVNFTDLELNFTFDYLNWESYDTCSGNWDDIKCDFKLDVKEEVCNETDCWKESTKFQYKYQLKNGVLKEDLKYIQKGNPLKYEYTFGGNSTTIKLQDNESENLGDVTTYDALPGGSAGGVVYIKFNITSVPLGNVIDDSTLCFYVSSRDSEWNNKTDFYNVNNQTWKESDSHSVLDNLPTSNLISSTSFGTSTGWACQDVTAIFELDYALSNDNCSIQLFNPDHVADPPDQSYYGGTMTIGTNDIFGVSVYIQIHSREYSTSSRRPYLNITYSPICDGAVCRFNGSSILEDIYIKDSVALPHNQRMAIKYDISPIPAGATIDNATTYLWINFVSGGMDADSGVYMLLNETWTEGISAGNFDIMEGTKQNLTNPTLSSIIDETWSSINVSNQIQACVDNSYDNCTIYIYDPDDDWDGTAQTIDDGTVLRLANRGGIFGENIRFWAREYAVDTTKRHYLKVGYTEVGGDTTPPTYSNNQTNITLEGYNATFSIKYDDDTALHPNGQYLFSTNNSGLWANDSAVNFTATPEWANVTKILNSTVGMNVGYRWYADDNAGNINNTEIFIFTITALPSPTWSNNQTNGTGFGENISFNVQWQNTVYNLSGYIFSFYSGSNSSSTDQEAGNQGHVPSSDPNKGWINFSEGWESGVIDGNWSNYSSAKGEVIIDPNRKANGTKGLTMATTQNNFFALNEIILERNLSGATKVNISFWEYEQETSHNGMDHISHHNGDAYYFTCDGTNWYLISSLGFLGASWSKFSAIALEEDNDWCGTANEDFSIKITEYDNWPKYTEYRSFDDINITYYIPIPEENGTLVFYNDTSISNVREDLTSIVVTVYISNYNNSGSIYNENNNPSLQLNIYNSSEMVNVGEVNINSTGNFSLTTTDSTILSAWGTPSNRNISLTPVFLDYVKVGTLDRINWTGVWVEIHSSGHVNDSFTGFEIADCSDEKKDCWSNVTKYINDPPGSTIKWRVWANNTVEKSNITDEFSFIVSGLAVTFQDPTPNNEIQNDSTSLYVNVTCNTGCNATLEWNGVNESMENTSTTNFYKLKPYLTNANYTFKVFASNLLYPSVTNATVTRWVYINMSVELDGYWLARAPVNFTHKYLGLSYPRRYGTTQGNGGDVGSFWKNDTLSNEGSLIGDEERHCNIWGQFYFDEPGIENETIDQIYCHIWVFVDDGDINDTYLGLHGNATDDSYGSTIWNNTRLNLSNSRSYSLNSTYYYLTTYWLQNWSHNITNSSDLNNLAFKGIGNKIQMLTYANQRTYCIINSINGTILSDNASLQIQDHDGDGLNDYTELWVTYTDPYDTDTDDDGHDDYKEYINGKKGYDPYDWGYKNIYKANDTDMAKITYEVVINSETPPTVYDPNVTLGTEATEAQYGTLGTYGDYFQLFYNTTNDNRWAKAQVNYHQNISEDIENLENILTINVFSSAWPGTLGGGTPDKRNITSEIMNLSGGENLYLNGKKATFANWFIKQINNGFEHYIENSSGVYKIYSSFIDIHNVSTAKNTTLQVNWFEVWVITGGNYVEIINPNKNNATTVKHNNTLTVEFDFYEDTVNLVSGVTVNNLTINGTECTLIGGATHPDEHWVQNCTTPYLSNGDVYLDLEINASATYTHTSQAIESVYYKPLQIINPAQANSLPTSNDTNITISFEFYENDTEIVAGLTVQNITIEGDLCTLSNTATHNGTLWTQNCTTPNKTIGYYDLLVVANTSTSGFDSDTEIDAIYYTPLDTCTYSGSGNWDVNCSDNCNITSNVDGMGNELFIIGNGYFLANANISNFTRMLFAGLDSNNRCLVACRGGNCFKR